MSFSFSARLRRCQWKTGFPTRFSFRSAQSINGCNGKRDTDSATFLASRPYERPLFGRLIVARGHVNSVRPAARLGRGAASPVATVASSGSTWYFSASSQNSGFSSLTFSGYLSATLSNWVQSFGQIIEFVRVTGRILAHCPCHDPRGPHDLCARNPSVVIDRGDRPSSQNTVCGGVTVHHSSLHRRCT